VEAADRVAAVYGGTIDAAEVRAIVRAFQREADQILGVEQTTPIPIEIPDESGIPSAMLQTLVAFTGGPVVVVATSGDYITTQARGYQSQEQALELLNYAVLGVQNPNGAVTEEGILVAPMQENR
jgi:hypothetical protein